MDFDVKIGEGMFEQMIRSPVDRLCAYYLLSGGDQGQNNGGDSGHAGGDHQARFPSL